MTAEPEADSFLKGAKLPRRLRELTVVDCDVHIYETPAALAPHCAQPWRRTLEYFATLPATYLGGPGFAPYLDAWPDFPPGSTRTGAVATPAQMRTDLDDLGVDVGILIPDCFLLHAAIRQPDYAVELARAYNRWLVDEWLADGDGLKGAVLAPPHDPAAAAEEIRRYAGHPDVCAVYLPIACVDPLYGHRRYDPTWDAAQETGLPLILHSGVAVHPVFPFNLHGFDTLLSAHVLAHPFSLMANLTSLLETGVPVRFPGLRFVLTEAGLGWVPFFLLRLDREHLSMRRDWPLLADRPSVYVKQSVFFSTQPLEESRRMQELATLISLFDGEDNVVFASDWPHLDFDHPAKVLQIPLRDEALAKILGGTATRLFGLEPAA
jgi:predicted TIM-barrel fold metal-dependent hydrolase